jgi:hypothetical protein
MPRPSYSTDEIRAAVDEHGTMRAAAKAIGMSYDALQKRLARAEDRFPSIPGKSILYDAESGAEKLVWAKGGKPSEITLEQITDAMSAVLKGYKPSKPAATKVAGNKDLLGIWPLADLHIGMRSWGEEQPGGLDWDIGIATEAYQEGLTEITEMTPKCKKGIVLVAGDLAHADNYQYQTGTPGTNHVVDCDGRYPKMVEASVNIVLFAKDRALERCETVEIVVLPGNHDVATAVAVRMILAAMFRGDKRVTVNTSPSRYWWYEWGSCMFACTHGDRNNIKRLPDYMADVMHEMWGRCKHRYAFTGHLHQKLVEQRAGVRIEILPTPVAPDSFATDFGYSAPRMFETKVYHRDRGLRCTPTVIL